MPHQSSYDFLFIAPTPFYANRGCHMRIRGEARALQDKDSQVLIVTYNAGENVKDLKIKRSFLNLGAWQDGPAASWKKIPATFFLFFTVFYWTIRLKPRILHCHLLEGIVIGIFTSFLVRILTLFSYKPILIFDTQGSRAQEMKDYGMIKEGSVYKFFLWLEKTAIYFSQYVFTSSLQYADKLASETEIGNKIHHLPDAISLFSWRGNDKEIEKLRTQKENILKRIVSSFDSVDFKKLKDWISANKIIVVYTGSFSPAKGLIDFINKSLSTISKNEKIRFLLGGGGIKDLDLDKKLVEQIYNKIIFVPSLSAHNLPYINMLGDVGIDPKSQKTTEASGKILNYMAMGLPVVCFGQKNNRYFIGEKGYFAKDFEQFTEMILKLVNSPEETKNEGGKNLKRAWEKFTWDLQAEKMLSILNNSNK
jgi:glycosyltransferase involved in cell wall biosynthesis